MRVLSRRELNRTLLDRQLLLARKRITVTKAVKRLIALQAQYAPSPLPLKTRRKIHEEGARVVSFYES